MNILRDKWPRDRAAEQSDELAPFQLTELHSLPASQARLQDIGLAGVSQEVFGKARRGQEALWRSGVPVTAG
jgi:hypothetical protein